MVKSLNWLEPHPPRGSSDYKWSEQDLITLSLTDYVIAADGECAQVILMGTGLSIVTLQYDHQQLIFVTL